MVTKDSGAGGEAGLGDRRARTPSYEGRSTIRLTESTARDCLPRWRIIAWFEASPLIGVPRTFTPYFANAPALDSPTPQFRAVCPPNPRRIASGRSFSMASV